MGCAGSKQQPTMGKPLDHNVEQASRVDPAVTTANKPLDTATEDSSTPLEAAAPPAKTEAKPETEAKSAQSAASATSKPPETSSEFMWPSRSQVAGSQIRSTIVQHDSLKDESSMTIAEPSDVSIKPPDVMTSSEFMWPPQQGSGRKLAGSAPSLPPTLEAQ